MLAVSIKVFSVKYIRSERGAMPLLAVILLLAVIVVAGVAVYHFTRADQKGTQAIVSSSPIISPTPAVSPASSPTASPMLVIKELGVEIPLKSGPSNLQYKMVTMSGQTVAALDTSQIDTAQNCSAGQLGFIAKTSGTISSGTTAFHTTDASGNKLDYLLKQFNGFYIQHVPAQNACDMPGGSIYPDKTTLVETIKAVDGLQLVQ